MFISQGQTDTQADNSGYSLYEMCVTVNTGTQLIWGSVFITAIVVDS
jgi:hypothetical protein